MSSIPRILHEHFAEYAALLPIYRALRSDDQCTVEDLLVWQQRLEAHRDALTLDPGATAPLLAEAFAGGDAAQAGAAIDLLLSIDRAAATKRAMQLLESSGDPAQAAGVIESLREQRVDLSGYASAIDTCNEAVASAVIELLAEQGQAVAPAVWQRLFRSQSPVIRLAAWRIAGDLSLMQ